MFNIYLVSLPLNYYPNIFAFRDENKAKDFCDNLNKEKGGSSSNIIEYGEISVLENDDLVEFKDNNS